MPTRVRSHAKINLGLAIGAPREDGFHALATVYQTLALFDYVTVSARRAPHSSITLSSNDPRVPTDARNTAYKIAALALEHYAIAADVSIHIHKQLPIQGGLGAGSANAVAALVGLLAELKAAHAPGNLGEWQPTAARVGSDVPLFLVGGAVLGTDRGQQVSPLPDFAPTWCVLALPDLGVSTPQAFRDWDTLCLERGLTAESSTAKLNELSRAYASAFAVLPQGEPEVGSSGVLAVGEDLAGPSESALVRTGILSWIANDFEQVVFRQHPSLADIKRILQAPGTPEAALYASLSGSGSALYGLYQTRGDAVAAVSRLRAAGVRSELTRTLPRTAYWREMIEPAAG